LLDKSERLSYNIIRKSNRKGENKMLKGRSTEGKLYPSERKALAGLGFAFNKSESVWERAVADSKERKVIRDRAYKAAPISFSIQ